MKISERAGAIAMAVYRPDPVLFTRQLRSLQLQTRSDFTCVISSDSDRDEVSSLVHDATADDPRFVVSGDGLRRGFYLNFERALGMVPPDVAWVALSDQDDEWYPDKLARLVPLLDRVSLVSCQSRVVHHPTGKTLLARTARRHVAIDDLVIQNQVTGAQAVFRADLLDLALPFPRVHAVTAVHDHWLAVCAAATRGYAMVDEVLQDYVQHDRNIIGEVSAGPIDVLGAWRRIRELAEEYEGSRSPRDMARVSNRLSFGWRRAVIHAVVGRLGTIPPGFEAVWSAFNDDHATLPMFRFLARSLRSDAVDRGTVFTFIPGVPAELIKATRLERLR